MRIWGGMLDTNALGLSYPNPKDLLSHAIHKSVAVKQGIHKFGRLWPIAWCTLCTCCCISCHYWYLFFCFFVFCFGLKMKHRCWVFEMATQFSWVQTSRSNLNIIINISGENETVKENV